MRVAAASAARSIRGNVLASGIFAIKAPQTDRKMSAAYRSMVAYLGKFTLEGNKWITKPDVAGNEAWLVDQERYFRIERDKLYVETAPQLNPNFGKLVRVTLVWARGN